MLPRPLPLSAEATHVRLSNRMPHGRGYLTVHGTGDRSQTRRPLSRGASFAIARVRVRGSTFSQRERWSCRRTVASDTLTRAIRAYHLTSSLRGVGAHSHRSFAHSRAGSS